MRFSSFFFTAALGELEFSLCGARIGRRRCERRTQRFRNFPNGARFWKNSNAFQRKLLIVSSPRLWRGSQLSRGAPTRRASEKVGSNKTKSILILSKEKRKNFKDFYQLKWRNRWSQQEIAFCCPIAPSKKAISKIVETNFNIPKTKLKIQEEK